MRDHCCSNALEKPTSPTNAPTAVPIPASVSTVLSRRRRRFFKTNPVNDNDLGMKLECVLLSSRGRKLSCEFVAAVFDAPIQNRRSSALLPIFDLRHTQRMEMAGSGNT